MTEDTNALVELLASIQKQNLENQQAQTEIQKKTAESLDALAKQGETLSGNIVKLSELVEKTTIPGQTMESKPKDGDSKQVGDPVKSPNELAPGQPGPEKTAPLTHESGSDRDGLQMENKSEEKKMDHEKEDKEVEKTDHEKEEEKMHKEKEVEKTDHEKEEDEKVEKSDTEQKSEYEVIKAVRSPYMVTEPAAGSIPNGAQLLKAFRNGWNGQHTDANKAFEHAQTVLKSIGGFD